MPVHILMWYFLVNYASIYINVIFYVKRTILMCIFVLDPGWPGSTHRPVTQSFYRVNYWVGSDNYVPKTPVLLIQRRKLIEVSSTVISLSRSWQASPSRVERKRRSEQTATIPIPTRLFTANMWHSHVCPLLVRDSHTHHQFLFRIDSSFHLKIY